MEIKSLRLSCSKDELQQLLVKKVARKSVFLDIENPVLSLDDGVIRIDCELNPAFSSRTSATVEFAVEVKSGHVAVKLRQVSAKVRPLGGLLGDWMFDGDWTKGKVMGAIERAVDSRAGILCSGCEICVDPNTLDLPGVKVTGVLRSIRIAPESIALEIDG